MLQFLLLIADESDKDKIIYLYENYHDEMLRFAKHRLARRGLPNYTIDAEDAVQNAFLKITKYISKINFSVSNHELRAYVLTIVANETNNIMNDYVYFDDLEDHKFELEDGDFFAQLRISERYNEVVNAIESMDEKYSIPLWSKYKQNMSVSEIAELLGVAEKTVYTRIERGRRLLIEIVNNGGQNNGNSESE